MYSNLQTKNHIKVIQKLENIHFINNSKSKKHSTHHSMITAKGRDLSSQLASKVMRETL